LLSFRFEAIQKQGEVQVTALGAHSPRIRLEGGQVLFEDQL
jgi:hypothetical protein